MRLGHAGHFGSLSPDNVSTLNPSLAPPLLLRYGEVLNVCGGRRHAGCTTPTCSHAPVLNPPSPLPHCRSEIARRREAGMLPQPPPPAKGMSREQAADALAVGASHPTWLVDGWLQQYGAKATMELLRWNNR